MSGQAPDPDDAARAETIASGGDAAGDAAAPVAPTAGVQLGRYLLGGELGAGGMATVYRARDTELRRDVAVKVLFPHLARKPEVTRRFHREARAAAGLEHANILRVYDVGESSGGPFIVMELVRGGSLRELAEAEGALLAELVACIGALLCDALAVAHKAGIVHRDVKPGNVMIADDGRLLLADFGVARLDDDDSLVTRTGAMLGTPSFMAPEQAHGQPVDARSDLYSVGVTLYQLGTGSLPFSGGPAKILAEAAKGAVPALRRQPAIGNELSRLIARLMAPAAADRPADAATVSAALRAIAQAGGLGEPIDEVRGYAVDRAAWRAARMPIVVARLVARAEDAAARRAIAPALALCDRVLAIDPGNGAATALVERLTRSNGRRRMLAMAAIGVAIAGAAAGGVAVATRENGTPGAAVAVAPVDAAASDAGLPIDAATEIDGALPLPIDAGAVAMAIDAAHPNPIPNPNPNPIPIPIPEPNPIPIPEPNPIPEPIDAGSIDAAARELDAAPAPGRVTFAFDTWCDLSIDGTSHGRADRGKPIELPPGTHEAECKQGLGQGAWAGTITVAAGAAQRVDGSLLPPITVENGLADSVRIRGALIGRGASAPLRPGRQRVEIVRGGKVVGSGWVTLPPRLARCTLRDAPELDCYP